MLKGTIGVATALFLVGVPVAHGQPSGSSAPAATPDNGRLSPAEFKILADVRAGVIKAALQLTPEQDKLWPLLKKPSTPGRRRAGNEATHGVRASNAKVENGFA